MTFCSDKRPFKVLAKERGVKSSETIPQLYSCRIRFISMLGPIASASLAWINSKNLLGSVYWVLKLVGGNRYRPISYRLRVGTISFIATGGMIWTFFLRAAMV